MPVIDLEYRREAARSRRPNVVVGVCVTFLANAIVCHPATGLWGWLARHGASQWWVSLSFLSAPLLAPALLAFAAWSAFHAREATPVRTVVSLASACASLLLWAHAWWLLLTD